MNTTKHEMSMHGWGEVAWSKVREVIGDNTCAWADYRGFQIGNCPEVSPPYSHLWAWSPDLSCLFRVRIDGERIILGALTSDTTFSFGPEVKKLESVEVLRYEGIPWGKDNRVRQPSPHIDGTIYLHETIQLAPVTFVGIGLSA